MITLRLTTKGRYAVAAMLDIAIYSKGYPVTLQEISERQNIPKQYLEQIFAQLRRSDLVLSTRGPGGGYQLKRCQSKIHLIEIIEAVSESIVVMKCQGAGNCKQGDTCLTHFLWQDLDNHIKAFLTAKTLAQVVKNYCSWHAATTDQLDTVIAMKH